MPEQSNSKVMKILDEIDMFSYRLADKLDNVLLPSYPSPNTAKSERLDEPAQSLLVMRLTNIANQLASIDNRINL